MPRTDEPHDSDDNLNRLVDEMLAEHESIPKAQRQRILTQTNHRCQMRGCLDISQGGQARVLVQRIEADPEQCGPDDTQNLTTGCIRCNRWVAQMPTRDDLPSTIKQRLNGVDPDSNQVAILNYVYQNEPAAPSDLLEVVEGDHRKLHTELDKLRSLDATNPDISEPVMVKNRIESVYGLPEQIPPDQRARGKIPLDPNERQARILDAFALQLDELLPDNRNKMEWIAQAVDRSVQNVYLMIQRAHADQFPLTEWADSNTSCRSKVSITEAIDLIARSTTNVSRRLVGDAVADLLKRNDEEELAADIHDWTHGNKPTASSTDSSETDSGVMADRDTETVPPRDVNLAPRPADQSINRTVVVDEDGVTRFDHNQRDD
jgi:hypothetical protein